MIDKAEIANPTTHYGSARHATREFKLQLALNNAFGKDYETAWYYNQPGRNTMLTLRYQPAP